VSACNGERSLAFVYKLVAIIGIVSLSGGGGGLEINFQFSSEPIIKVHRSTEVFYYENALSWRAAG
jgi:hypothetical protein